MQPYNTPERIGTDQGGSVDKPIPYMQRGHSSGKINTTDTFLPCDLDQVDNILITPIRNASSTSDNPVALFTTVAGYEFTALGTFLGLGDIDDWATGVVYEIGTVVDGNADDTIAYICVEAHTADASFSVDLAATKWQALATSTFVKLVHTAGGSGDVVNFNYILHGTMNR
jgi:hypothetical protein